MTHIVFILCFVCFRRAGEHEDDDEDEDEDDDFIPCRDREPPPRPPPSPAPTLDPTVGPTTLAPTIASLSQTQELANNEDTAMNSSSSNGADDTSTLDSTANSTSSSTNSNMYPDEEYDWAPPEHLIAINISVALPVYTPRGDLEMGIPKRIATVVKDYLNTTGVEEEFLKNLYVDLYDMDGDGIDETTRRRRFDIDIIVPPPPPNRNNGYGGGSGRLLGEEDTSNGDNDSDGKQENTLPSTEMSIPLEETLVPVNVSQLAMFALTDLKATLVDRMPGAHYAWFQHTVYLAAHEGYKENGRPKKIRDPALMEWLQAKVQEIVYDDIRLQGPLGPYYDDNNYYDFNNNKTRKISYIEWALQNRMFPVGSVAIPGEENWDFMVGLPDPNDGWSTSSDEDSQDIPEDAGISPGTTSSGGIWYPASSRYYGKPLSTAFSLTEWLGAGCLICTIVFTIAVMAISNEFGKRRAQNELWGNMLAFENAEEDTSFLDVGWRFAVQDPDGANKESDEHRIQNQRIVMELFDKEGLGYREGDSMLIGGYEYE